MLEAASSAARISGWSRVCSWNPISRFASARKLSPGLRVLLEPALLVAGERLAQAALPVGRVAGPQSLGERLEPSGVGRLGGWALLEVAGEVEPDFLEHLEVPARDALARALEGVERRVQLVGQAPDPRAGLEKATA